MFNSPSSMNKEQYIPGNGDGHKMIGNSRDKEFSNKQEDELVASNNTKRLCTSKAWSLFKDPRIVRVSRSFGKKDRHSKVNTIRGLRDRRIRLSVPTAIQLYDLQEKLGLNQPSKVVDWLINVAQHEINVLPPLQMLQENYIHHPQLITTTCHANMHQAPSTSLMDKNLDCFKDCGSQSLTLFSNKMDEKRNDAVIEEEEIILPKPSCWNSDNNLRGKSKYDSREIGIERSNWNKWFGQENQDVNQVHNPFCLLNHSSHSSLVSNAIPHNPYYDHEPSNNSMTHSGGSHRYSSQAEELHHSNSAPMPSSLSLSSRTQLLLYQSMTTPSTLLPYISSPLECDSKHVNCSQILSLNSQNIIPPSLATSLYSISPTIRQFQVNMNNKHQHHQNIQVSSLHKASSGLTNAFGSRSLPNELNSVDGSNSSSVHIQMCVSNEDLH